MAATQWAMDFKVDIWQILEHFGVADKPRMLQKLDAIYQCARENQERLRGGTS